MEQVQQILDRMGIVTRESVATENIPGGFSAIYPILRALEDLGKIRRGYFIDGLGGAQFAAPGADERLRNLTSQENVGSTKSIAISAVDPANPFGVIIPWPSVAGHKAIKPQRTSGALVLIQGGLAIGYLNRGYESLTTFRHTTSDLPAMPKVLAAAIAKLTGSHGPILLASIDGHPAQDSDLAPDFLTAGFQSSSSGLRHGGI
jgi:ATP-dependent Lhr-like helicase